MNNVKNLLKYIIYDVYRYSSKGEIRELSEFNITEFLKLSFQNMKRYGLQSIIIYRFSHFIHNHTGFLIRLLLSPILFFTYHYTRMFLGIEIHYKAKIGPGAYIGHFGGIIISPKAITGKNFSIESGVVIGERGGRKKDDKAPRIGDHVKIGTGAKVLGNIKIGNNVLIGANSVVIKSIKSNSTAVGIPARVIPWKK